MPGRIGVGSQASEDAEPVLDRIVQPSTRQVEAGSRDRAGQGRAGPDTSTVCMSMAMRMFGISYLRLNSVKKTLWTSALRGHKLSSLVS